MQTKLEKNAIEKRVDYYTKSEAVEYGPQGDQVKGNSPNNPYDEYGSNAQKSKDGNGSISDHLNIFDLTKGGSVKDIEARERQLGYAIEGLPRYTKDNQYTQDSIDTDKNIGQVVIY